MTFTKETASQAGKKGGNTTKKKYGLMHFSKNGKKGQTKRWRKKKKK